MASALTIVRHVRPERGRQLLRCRGCGHTADPASFRYGRGRHLGEHPEHRICPACGGSIDWYGFAVVEGEVER